VRGEAPHQGRLRAVEPPGASLTISPSAITAFTGTRSGRTAIRVSSARHACSWARICWPSVPCAIVNLAPSAAGLGIHPGRVPQCLFQRLEGRPRLGQWLSQCLALGVRIVRSGGAPAPPRMSPRRSARRAAACTGRSSPESTARTCDRPRPRGRDRVAWSGSPSGARCPAGGAPHASGSRAACRRFAWPGSSGPPAPPPSP
jgi:hypothetical protein